MHESRTDDFVRIENDTTLGPRDRPPLINSTGYATGSEYVALTILTRNDNAVLVSLGFYVTAEGADNRVGIYHPMTPDGARMLGEKLISAAADAERDSADAAAAQLAATLARGKPDACA